MPIYAYKCESCGFAKDVLQKMSDTPLEVCPSCSASAFKKQLTAAGFQLKGSGWYATDFKGSGSCASQRRFPGSGGRSRQTQSGCRPCVRSRCVGKLTDPSSCYWKQRAL
jgi:putative FmdB family regulatory protein